MKNRECEKIYENVKLKISISNFDKEENIEVKKNSRNIFKIGAVACCMLVLTTGVVFAKEIGNFIKYYFGNKIVDKAAENGYVAEINSNIVEEKTVLVDDNTGIIIDDVNVAVKFDEFVMDDITLSTNMTFEFDEKIKEVFDLDKLQHLAIKDLIIIDDENKILLSTASKTDFEKLCEKYNLNHTFGVYDENQYNCSYDKALLGHDKETNIVNFNLNINPANQLFPKSKELTFIFSKIQLEKFEEYNGQDIENGEYLKSNSITLTGDWEFKFEVPEKMYNRERNEYKVVSKLPENIEVSYAIASETGFKFNAIISNVKQRDFSKEPFKIKENELLEQRILGEITEEEYTQKLNELMESEEYRIASRKIMREYDTITTSYVDFADDEERSIDKVTHITNSIGKKFEILNSSLALIDMEENKYEFDVTFDMSKIDATDKLTVTLIYYGEPVYVELEKVEDILESSEKTE